MPRARRGLRAVPCLKLPGGVPPLLRLHCAPADDHSPHLRKHREVAGRKYESALVHSRIPLLRHSASTRGSESAEGDSILNKKKKKSVSFTAGAISSNVSAGASLRAQTSNRASKRRVVDDDENSDEGSDEARRHHDESLVDTAEKPRRRNATAAAEEESRSRKRYYKAQSSLLQNQTRF